LADGARRELEFFSRDVVGDFAQHARRIANADEYLAALKAAKAAN